MADSDSDHMIPIRVTDVAGLRDMATKHALRHTHYDGCDRAHIECAAIAAADEIERLEFERDEHRDAARAYRAEIERLRAVLDAIDDLHSPRIAHDTCLACDHDWPCETYRLVREARRG